MSGSVEHNKSFEEGFHNGFAEGRTVGLEYGKAQAIEECIAILQERLIEAKLDLQGFYE